MQQKHLFKQIKYMVTEIDVWSSMFLFMGYDFNCKILYKHSR